MSNIDYLVIRKARKGFSLYYHNPYARKTNRHEKNNEDGRRSQDLYIKFFKRRTLFTSAPNSYNIRLTSTGIYNHNIRILREIRTSLGVEYRPRSASLLFTPSKFGLSAIPLPAADIPFLKFSTVVHIDLQHHRSSVVIIFVIIYISIILFKSSCIVYSVEWYLIVSIYTVKPTIL